MKKIFPVLFLLCTLAAFGQKKPSNFDTKVIEAIEKYQASYNLLANGAARTSEKKAAVFTVKKIFSSTGTYIFDDIEFIKNQNLGFVKMGNVFKNIDSFFPLGHKIQFNTKAAVVGEIIKNYERNTLSTEVKIKKKISYRLETEIQDSMRIDVVSNDTTIFSHKDTVMESTIVSLIIVFKYDIENSQLVNLKIDAITKAGKKPKYKKLKGDDKWWVSLDKQWKTFFIDELEMPEFPDKYDFGKLEYVNKINLSGRQFDTYYPLKRLKRIRVLDLSKSNFENDSILHNLKMLRELNLSESKIKRINGVGKLVQLEVLKLNKLKLSSIEPLKTLTNLLELEIKENELLNIDAVKNMANLKRIDFSLNLEIRTIQPLAGLTNLTKVKFVKMKVKDLTPLSNCPNLVELNCFNNEITSLKPIARCYKMTTLNIGYNKIYTLDELSGLKFIVLLYMKGAPVSDLSVLRNFVHLERIDLSETFVTNLSPLYGAERILSLYLINSKVSVGEKDRFKKKFPKCRLTYY